MIMLPLQCTQPPARLHHVRNVLPAHLPPSLLLLLLLGERIMKLAEELYQGGWISYPRTETDVYDQGMDLRVSLGEQLTACTSSIRIEHWDVQDGFEGLLSEKPTRF
jgi:hypothetical protein